ncbi:helix-turn-helix transcriptional regulator [bacterium]|nr:helix-turn-helix transcriptional regulator [bacterium]
MSNSTILTLQNNIKKFRKEKGITQLKLSIMTGLSKDYIAAIECGRRVPSVKRLILIASKLNIEIYKFFI